MLPLWVDFLEGAEPEVREKLLSMSAASMDRLLKPSKTGSGKKRLPPRGNTAIKAAVEVRAENWNVQEAGWTEVDTVAHCGRDMGGSFIWTLTSVDIASGWTEVRASWNRGQHATREGLEEIAKAQPFDLKGVDSDNGAEFLNCHLYDWLREQGIRQTRSRPYRKNDQAHVEQKNYTHVRLLLGYDRLEHPELIAPLNELLRTWSLWRNLYCVTMEQISKRREGSRQIRQHAKTSRTPAQRLLDGQSLTAAQRKWIEREQRAHSPFAMKKQIEAQLAGIWKFKQKLEKADALTDLAAQAASPLRCETACAA
jgi:transposase InsO family protein